MTPPLASKAVEVQSPTMSDSPQQSDPNVHSLAVLWAKKYYLSVTGREEEEKKPSQKPTDITSKEGRTQTAIKLMQNLTLASAQAWSLTETLLSQDIRRHNVNPDLINPLEIAADTRFLFQKALDAYSQGVPPQRLSVIVGKHSGWVRKKYTSTDPRAIGFVSMQFHYTGQKVLEWLLPGEQELFAPYLKVMDDHMYMPLQAAYEAAANYEVNSPILRAVQHLLPISTKIAHSVYEYVCRQNPGYQCYTGLLNSDTVKISSIRDVEMFQVYLCLCVLENNIRSVQHELFPLCVMLYPRLKVSWTLVQEMLLQMGWQMHENLSLEDVAVFLPYVRMFSDMFSTEVFQNDI